MKKKSKRKTLIPARELLNGKLPINDQKRKYGETVEPYYLLNTPGQSDSCRDKLKNNSFAASASLSSERPLSNNERYKVAVLYWEGLPWNQGGVESRLISDMVADLFKDGHEIHVFTQVQNRSLSYKKIHGVHYHCIYIDLEIGLLNGINVFAQKVDQRIKRVEAKEGHFDVVHCYNWYHAKIIKSIQDGVRRRIIFTPGMNGANGAAQKGEKNNELLACRESWESQLVRSSDRIVCFEIRGCNHMHKHFSLPAEKISFIPREFHWEDFQWIEDPGEIKKKYQIGPLDPLVLFVGDLNHEYGADILTDAVPGLIENHPQIRFLLVGEGKLMWPVRIKAHYLLFEHAVRLVGNKEGKDLQELFQAADIIVIPHRTAISPYHVFAAWSSQKPVVSTHAGGCNLVRHSKNGILVYDNPHSIKWGIEKILYDWDKGDEIARNGWREIKQNYTWNALGHKLGHIYRFSRHDIQKREEKTGIPSSNQSLIIRKEKSNENCQPGI